MQEKQPWMVAVEEARKTLVEIAVVIKMEFLYPVMEKLQGLFVWFAWLINKKEVVNEATYETIMALDDDDDWEEEPWGSEYYDPQDE